MSWEGALSTGTSYAAAGSMLGPWGAAAGFGVGALMGAFQDDGTIDVEKLLGGDLDKARQRATDNSLLAKNLTAKGDDALSGTLSYYRNLLSGNPAAVMSATAPDRGRVIDQYDGARKAMATFGPRGGGQTAAAGQSQVSEAQDLSEILQTARDKGAAGSAQVGGQLLGAGMQANSLAGQDLNSVINSVLSSAGLQMQQNQQQQAQGAAQGEAMGQLIGLLLTKRGGASMGAGGGGIGTAGIGGAMTPNLGAGL